MRHARRTLLPAQYNHAAAAASVNPLRESSEHELVISKRIRTIRFAPDFAKSALSIEIASACLGVIRIEPDCIGGPLTCDADRLLHALATDSPILKIRTDRHAGQIKRSLTGGEVGNIDRPRLLCSQPKRGYDCTPITRNPHLCMPEFGKGTALGGLVRPMPASITLRQIAGRSRPDVRQRGGVRWRSELKDHASYLRVGSSRKATTVGASAGAIAML